MNKFWFLALLLSLGYCVSAQHKIEHVVVLMFENHSFDQMLGYLKQVNPEIDGLTGDETNPYDPQDPSKGYVKVSDDSPYVTDPDPDHSLIPTQQQIFGFQNPNDTKPPVPMSGFVLQYKHHGAPDNGSNIMKMFNREKVPTISSLAEDFAIFDHWFSDVPGPTQPNRLFFGSATSHGAISDNVDQILEGYPQPTIFDHLYEQGHSWRNYYSDVPSLAVFLNLRDPIYAFNYYFIDDFKDDCKTGNLPAYSFVDPRYFKFLDWNATDEHPPHDVRDGEMFLADVYSALRQGKKWNETLFIVTFDEHGGYYDHVPTPIENVVPPDDFRPPPGYPYFGFNRLGVRVPTIMASPWIPKGTVIHGPTGSQEGKYYSHSSFAATMKEMFDLPKFLTKRDENAATFSGVLNLKEPRTDCIEELETVGGAKKREEWRKMTEMKITEERIERGTELGKMSLDGLTGLQKEFLNIVNGLSPEGELREETLREYNQLKTEHDAALFVRRKVAEWRERIESEARALSKSN